MLCMTAHDIKTQSLKITGLRINAIHDTFMFLRLNLYEHTLKNVQAKKNGMKKYQKSSFPQT